MKKMRISTKVYHNVFYSADPLDDRSGVVIRRVERNLDGNSPDFGTRTDENVVSFIEHGDFVYTTIETGKKQYDVAVRRPGYDFYDPELVACVGAQKHFMEFITPQGHFMRVRFGRYDEEEKIFTSLVITLEINGEERYLGIAEVDEYDDLSVTIYGDPAENEIETF